jgi:anti-sigma regulatory factor (Ser/Thr protein kinase)
MTDMSQEVSLEIPVDPAFAITARRFVAAAARDLGLPIGSVEDLRLTVSELVTNAVEGNEPGPIVLTLTSDREEVVLRAAGVGSIGDDPPIGRRSLLRALFEIDDPIVDGIVRISVARDPAAGAADRTR